MGWFEPGMVRGGQVFMVDSKMNIKSSLRAQNSKSIKVYELAQPSSESSLLKMFSIIIAPLIIFLVSRVEWVIILAQ